ncbi:uncharacterized protein [Prorops nasuta]|uniref:uncharacterized protein n=1 Tax=Prorops nasuta TaxID=863751 RepID=UPI0034CE695B
MFSILLTVVLAVIAVTFGQVSQWKTTLRDDQSINVNSHSKHQARFFPLFSVVRFANSECIASNNFIGTCFTRRECLNYGGTPSGSCANGLGICCIFQKTCGATTNINNTYFINPNYPTTYKGGDRCTISIQRCNTNICQLRLDFLDSSFTQPNASGICDNDLFLVSGAASIVPRLCGENTNQHVYLDFNGANPITISVDTLLDTTFERRWNIRIHQIACDSVYRAPNGCLQYYQTVSGTVTSFNFGSTPNARAPLIGTREMANLMYGVCIKMAPGYCSIEWMQTNNMSFTVSGDTGSIDPMIIGTAMVAESGTTCTKDFVIIPNPVENNVAAGTERFCGNGFVTKSSNMKPFVLYVVTDADEAGEIQNRGFMLSYRQLPCAV